MAGSLKFPGIDLSADALFKRQRCDEHYNLRENLSKDLRVHMPLSTRIKLCADVKYLSALIDALELAITTKGNNEHKIKPAPLYRAGGPRLVYKPATGPRPKDSA